MATSVKGKHSGTKETVLAFARDRGAERFDELTKFVNQLYSQNVFDAFMICAQSANETSNWTDTPWSARLNPAGMGIMDDQDLGYSFDSGADAAKAMLVHHAAYTGTQLPSSWQSWVSLDPRYQAVFDAGYSGKIKNWEDYGNGYWATDPNYFNAISERAAAMHSFDTGGGGGDTYVPTIIDKWLHVAQSGYDGVERRYIGRGGMSPKVIFLHIQEGSNWGSWEHFHVVSASATVLIGKNGEIWRLVPESDGPWTNGDVKSPTARGQDILNRFGPDPNWYTLSIETEGYTGEWPKDKVQLDAVAWQIKQWMKKYNIPLSLVVRHAEVNQVDRAFCPGDAYYNYMINRIKNEGTGDIVVDDGYPDTMKVLVNGKPWDGAKDVTVNDVLFHANKQKVTAAVDANVRMYASTESVFVRDPYGAGQSFNVLGWVSGEEVDGEARWWITSSHARVWVGTTNEKPSAKPPIEPKPEKLPAGAKILNGRVYYPAKEDDKPRKIVLTRDANLHKSAAIKSDILHKAKKGEEYDAYYWTFGDEVNKERAWWVLKRGDTDPLTQGYRLTVNATKVRPD